MKTALPCDGQRRLVLRVDQLGCRRVLRIPREVLEEEFDRAGRVAVASVFREHEIAKVRLAFAEPVVVRIVVMVDPPNYLAADADAGGRAGVIGAGPAARKAPLSTSRAAAG